LEEELVQYPSKTMDEILFFFEKSKKVLRRFFPKNSKSSELFSGRANFIK